MERDDEKSVVLISEDKDFESVSGRIRNDSRTGTGLCIGIRNDTQGFEAGLPVTSQLILLK